jgi:hypothetical protein
MGNLAHFDLRAIRETHGLKSFVETGTGDGNGVVKALLAGYEVIHSIEIDPELASLLKLRFRKNPMVTIHEGDSRELLESIVRQLPLEPALFWLDAHFPGAELGIQPYGAEPDPDKRFPLRREVDTILGIRRGIADVILIDDARIYQDGPYRLGPIPPDWKPLEGLERGLDFIRDGFRDTHGVVIDYADTGYVMVTPRMQPCHSPTT